MDIALYPVVNCKVDITINMTWLLYKYSGM